ncbi:SPW repeat domain-containing protein [Enterovirga sp. CN4-39]|uniref:SPW repeat domain-containing protein n=1 Tax=Enterovirga sp. CN4-39 TaxID=3400910 RepID=UPI003BFBDE31
MRFIPTRLHGIIDYIWGLLLGTAPWTLGFADNGPATYVALIFGIGAILYSLATNYEVGLLPLIPMPVHLVLDVAGGAMLAVSPWLFGFADRVFWPHLLFGLFSIAAGLMTEKDTRSPDRIASERI